MAGDAASVKGWEACYNKIKDYDTNMVEGYKDELDTLLIFVNSPRLISKSHCLIRLSQAGLFSAVLTAFLVQSQQSLEQSPEDRNTQILALIYDRLATNASVIQMTQPLPKSLSHVSSSEVVVNALWVASLILSLLAALFIIIVKQWLCEYLEWTGIMPTNLSLSVRQHRHAGFLAWKVPQIIALLPILLQVALVLFLCGLIDLLWSLHRSIAFIAIGLIVPALSATILAIFMPVLFRGCPYRSPHGLAFIRLRGIPLTFLRVLNSFAFSILRIPYSRRLPLIRHYVRLLDLGIHGSWKYQDAEAARKEDSDRLVPPDEAMGVAGDNQWSLIAKEDIYSKSIDGEAFTWLHATFYDAGILRDIVPCFRDIEPRSRLQHLIEVAGESMYFRGLGQVMLDYSQASIRHLMNTIPVHPNDSDGDRERSLTLAQKIMSRHKRMSLPLQATQIQMLFTVIEYEANLDRPDRFFKRIRHGGSFVDALCLLTLALKSQVNLPRPPDTPANHSHDDLVHRYISLLMTLLAHLGVEPLVGV